LTFRQGRLDFMVVTVLFTILMGQSRILGYTADPKLGLSDNLI